jgi:hypothetical protein
MEWNRIEALVEKYWEGETSVEEEKELKQFFSTSDPSHWPESVREVADLFRYYAAEEATQPLGQAFDDRLFGQLKTRPSGQESKLRPLYFNWLKLAACLVIVVSAVLVFRNQSRKMETQAVRQSEQDTFEDPQRAYEETRKALLLVSVQLNKGKSYAGEIRKINEAEDLIRQE